MKIIMIYNFLCVHAITYELVISNMNAERSISWMSRLKLVSTNSNQSHLVWDKTKKTWKNKWMGIFLLGMENMFEWIM